jgi:hypothetical protein
VRSTATLRGITLVPPTFPPQDERFMDAHQVLGLAPTATLDDAEDAYRRLLRVHHPDLHQDDGPGALAAAELRTAAINAAIAHVRRVARSEPVGVAAPWIGFDPAAWHNDPDDDHPQVACPLCDEWFSTAGSLKAHAATAHEMRMARPRRSWRRPRFPAVSLAVFAPANLLVALLVGATANQVLGSAAVAVWATALTMAPSAIRMLTSDG